MPTSNFAAHEAEFKKAFIYVTNFALRMQWYGACHATTAVLFCIAKKLGIDAVPCIGEAQKDGIVFDHSWLEIEGKVFDIAILLPFKMSMSTGPIYNEIDMKTGLGPDIEYGVSFRGLDEQATYAFSMNLYEYLRNCPSPYLIDLVKDACSSIGVYVSNKWIRENLSNEHWKLVKKVND